MKASWCKTINLGDALSPVILSKISGLPCEHVPSKYDGTRIASTGTIGHMLEDGEAIVWGSGWDTTGSWKGPASKIKYSVRAVRGAHTRDVLMKYGIDVPPVYGDPVWLLPELFDLNQEKKYELGVILHISEVDKSNFTGDNASDILENKLWTRYSVPDELKSSIKLIVTYLDYSNHTKIPKSGNYVIDPVMREKIETILSCKRILSTSLHGMVFSESFKIPCSAFPAMPGGSTALNTSDSKLDHRFRDLYSGLGIKRVPA
ncbi:MAG: polysaccharide pyruvyl transferase family protein, partial [Flavobacteriia bacterium]|nr:polysaccharide pyruvyl transferase family protein [Flavobacteriia bacterium]